MADVVSKKKRSEMMSGIKGKDTRPEMQIRSAIHKLGFRYKLYDKTLPGKPDLVFPKYNAVIFIHGCFWHLHDCHLFKWPSTRPEFWREKINGNRERDKKIVKSLKEKDWRIMTIWECALKGKYRLTPAQVVDKIAGWLLSNNPEIETRGIET
jgi:DNA mismatch endonuclease, patch repair protein